MKTAIIAVAGLAAAATAQSFVVDLSGVGVEGGPATVLNANNPNSGPITTIDYDISVTTTSPSWGAEVQIILTHVASGFSVFADGNGSDDIGGAPVDVAFGWGNSTGTFSFAGSYDATGQLADVSGAWTVTLRDDFSDTFAVPDHIYNSGSTITVNSVPTPAGLALLGLGGLVASRRRR